MNPVGKASAADAPRPSRPKVPLEFPAPQYGQELAITFAGEQAARQASVRIAPLFDGRQWAVSSRWDDNHPGSLPMHDCLARHGQSGTFYLNGLYADWSLGTPVLDSKYGRDLLDKGASIGCHSLTHPMLSFCGRNRMFEEMIGDRMQWEAAVDKPVMSYAFSYCNFANPQEGLAVQADIARLLERSGFYNVANEAPFEDIDSELTLSPIMPSDGADIDGFVQKALADPRFQAAHPNLTYSMHAWYDTPEKWARFEAQLDKYGHRSDWWYCNQNQYGAYRYQFQRAKLTPAAPQGKTLRLHLERPMLLDLNDDTPLTLEVAGVRPDDIVSVTCPTAACKASQRKGGLFHVYHDKDQALPKKIGMVPVNFANRHAPAKDDYDSDFPDLHALVHFEGGQVRFLMENRSDKALSRVRLTYRLPLAWKEGVVRRELPDLPAGTSAADALRPTLAQSDLRYNTGRGFYAVQVDFVLGDQPGRLHLACITASSKQADPSYPCNGFVLLGPVPKEQLDGDKFAKNVQDGRVGLVDFVTGDQRRLSWRAADPMRQPHLDVEMIPLTVNFLPNPGMCVLASVIQSPTARKVDLLYYNGLTRVFLNRQEVTGKFAVDLRAGDNELLILTVEWGGFFLRCAEPAATLAAVAPPLDTRPRLRDIRYVRPRLPANNSSERRAGLPAATTEPYRLAPAVKSERISLAGKWRAVLVHALPPSTHDSPYPDAGISPEARKLLAAETDASTWQELDVPSAWSHYGEPWARADGEAVFQKVIDLPAAWEGKDLAMSLGTIDDFDETFFNGASIGKTDINTADSYRVARHYDVPGRLVKAGRNVLTVRIFDRFGDAGFTGGDSDLYIQQKRSQD